MKFTSQDLAQIKAIGKQPEEVQSQLDRFVNGFPDIELYSTVSKGNGLTILSKEELKQCITRYEKGSAAKQLCKFVPASGAASRMFKALYNFLDGQTDEQDEGVQTFFNDFDNFAFSDELAALLGNEKEELLKNKSKKVVELLLSETGLNYGNLPKALLTFHKYKDDSVTKAIDEHLVEGALYCAGSNDKVAIHFTVSEEHMSLIKSHLEKILPIFEKKFDKQYIITFSVQDKATDTVAVDLDNQPIRKENGELLFRPGGHGALLKNLDAIDADIIFIKNIDNVAAQWLIQDTIDYKKALGGVLLETQNKIFDYCQKLQNSDSIDAKLEEEILEFLGMKLGYKAPNSYNELAEPQKVAFLFNKLNRPMRICGVVQSSNTGGGPFWVKHPDGALSLQLVETAQVNLQTPAQTTILKSSEYANITDLVCGVRDFEGNKFDLMKFRDPDTGFIAEKSQGGKVLKAMELPGLWNGAMSDWNTAFVEVPMTTFNPVKTVLDLLNKEHQGAL
ncbi:DUF4301 family protein [Mangrovibacterium diazotrophicum]|uniref:Uncharacterized protein DUF4301 n=1 Tax=Mangrovibacterium diazotrophicum TaxID=1261403 RepID=A0A419W3T4_9BACT|nr:DUF4301 family protein [Mangrovibacterium diazotrophicum]RKD90103.1 uncharacterized protein DUF4301 [Mangrovibacterium diazotrophicum]